MRKITGPAHTPRHGGQANGRWWIRAVLVWLALLVLATANGALREAYLLPAWGRPAGLVASGALLSLAILAAYTFRDGNLWPLVLLVNLLAPVLALRARRSR